ncbi:MAG: DUF106 domain-containing protein [Thermoplasmata archaeon]|nr:MAG: DUF106 domain-containing protein [Thermoplasmata archaeon]
MAQKQQSSLLFFLALMFAIFVLFDPNLRASLGNAVGVAFTPLLGFNHHYPVLTIFLAGSIVIIISALIRHFTTNWIEIARNQAILSKFQKEYRKARLSNNKYMIKKLQKIQPEIMKKQGEISSKQMKMMPVTLLIFIPIFTWIWDFLLGTSHYFFDVPWATHVNFFGKYAIFPNWILLYMLLSIPLTQVIQYLLKTISWRRDIHEG